MARAEALQFFQDGPDARLRYLPHQLLDLGVDRLVLSGRKTGGKTDGHNDSGKRARQFHGNSVGRYPIKTPQCGADTRVCRVESHSTLIAWWGGPLGPRGTPSPRFSPDGSTLAPPRQADGGVGRGPGGPPHQARRSRDSAQLFMQFRGPKAHPNSHRIPGAVLPEIRRLYQGLPRVYAREFVVSPKRLAPALPPAPSPCPPLFVAQNLQRLPPQNAET